MSNVTQTGDGNIYIYYITYTYTYIYIRSEWVTQAMMDIFTCIRNKCLQSYY